MVRGGEARHGGPWGEGAQGGDIPKMSRLGMRVRGGPPGVGSSRERSGTGETRDWKVLGPVPCSNDRGAGTTWVDTCIGSATWLRYRYC